MSEQFTVESLEETNFSAEKVAPIAELLCAVWPKPGRTVETRVAAMTAEMDVADQRLAPRGFVVCEGGSAIAFAQMLPRTVGTTLGDITIAGLARVCSHPDHRGRGLGEVVVRAAFELVDRGEFEWSLYQTSTKVRPFYERLGAVVAKNRIVNSCGEDPEANPFWDTVVMRYPSNEGWPSGDIDLRGPGY